MERVGVGGVARNLLVEARPRQWVKNSFVLAPLFFSQSAFVAGALGRALAAFGCFCLVSSSVYLFNGWRDRAEDRLHPQKRNRPLAAGFLAPATALVAAFGLLVAGLVSGYVIKPPVAWLCLAYWSINALYTVALKHQVILDVFALASGFVLRVVAGGVAIGVPLSPWLLLCTMLLALFLGFCKRRHELVLLGDEAGRHRPVLRHYDARFLDAMIGVVTSTTLMSYGLYTMSEETVRKFHTRGLLLTFPFVLYGLFRYLYLVYRRERGGDPTQDLLADRPTVVNALLWVATAGAVLYWR